MKKTVFLLIIILLITYNKSQSQNYEKSGISIAFGTGFGFADIKSPRLNGGAYGLKKENQDFKYRPLYWSGAFAAKRKSHEFGIEYEQLNYKSDMTYTNPSQFPVTYYNSVRTLKFRYFNMYYKYLFPMEYKKFTPYLKAALNINIYSFYEEVEGKYLQSSVGFGGRALSLVGGANYNITDYFSVFTEVGYGPILCKFGARISWLPN